MAENKKNVRTSKPALTSRKKKDMSEKLDGMTYMREKVLKYLGSQKKVYEDALKENESPVTETDVEVRKMREHELQRLRDRIYEINHHIEVVKLMT